MRFLIADTYYSNFLHYFRNTHPQIRNVSYQKQLKCLLGQKFGTSDYYSFNLKKLGYETDDIIVNDAILQSKWVEEQNITVDASILDNIRVLPLTYHILGRPRWIQSIALFQIAHYRPDVLYIQDLTVLNPETLRSAKRYCKLIVGQIASPMPPIEYIKEFDLILTSFPHFVNKLKSLKVASEYFRIGFEPRILSLVGQQAKRYCVSFVGSFSLYHHQGTKLFEEVARDVTMNFWGPKLGLRMLFSPIRKGYHGQAWGLNMYKILAQSKIIINRHIDVAEDYANNMRLFESTGMGALLITDEKKNLHELFRIGKEIITYKNSADLIKKIKYYLEHEDERQKIAKAGQMRTLKDHTYLKRMEELVKIIKKYI